MTFHFRPPVRSDIKPLIGLYGQSGSGKTFSSLLLARGLVGPEGKIALIDTESGRGSLYADEIPGGYEVVDLEPPFTPERYIAAHNAAEQQGFGVVIIDSVSHEWEGIGGILDQATEIEVSSGKSGLHCWGKPKQAHNKFVQRLLRSSIPVIVNMRAKFKSKQGRNSKGKTEIIKDDFTSPIQADDFIFEMTVHAEIMQGSHAMRLTKHSSPSLCACFEDGRPISIETGEALARWCRGEGDTAMASAILNAARQAAEGGKDSLQAWWKAADQSTRRIANTIMEDLKNIAAGAEASDEIPF